MENGGFISDPVGAREKILHTVEQTVKKGMEKTKDILPFKEARAFLGKKILTGYDHIDVNITKLRTFTDVKVGAMSNEVVRIAHIKELTKLIDDTIYDLKYVDFPGREGLLENLEKL